MPIHRVSTDCVSALFRGIDNRERHVNQQQRTSTLAGSVEARDEHSGEWNDTAVPSYAQAMAGAFGSHPASARWAGFSASEDDQSSVPDIGSVVAPSDTDDGHTSFTQSPRKRGAPSSALPRAELTIRTRAAVTTPEPGILRPSPTTPKSVSSPNSFSSPGRSAQHDASESEFYSSGLSRAGSVYSLSRVSLASQLAQLTSIQLPSASGLAARITSMPTSHLAAKALIEAGDKIKLWTGKASRVLNDLDAHDDVEWAAAGGRDGLEDVDQAITRFEGLVRVYVISIEELQMRKDITTLSDQTLGAHVEQMETIVQAWQRIKKSLQGVKEQVEIAMEWEEIWNAVLGEIGHELNALGELVFQMEEKRHHSAEFKALIDTNGNIDIDDLATVVERSPKGKGTPMSSRLSLPPPFSPSSPIESPSKNANKEDSNLLALFARMQPLRASLDFLPMRLSTFHIRGNPVFPSACIDLEHRRDTLEEQWNKLEADAESLRKELGEDRWVLVFRNAGRQAVKMFESVERSQVKLEEAAFNGTYTSDPPLFTRIVESYEAKKLHYVPAVRRVLTIIDRGVLDRLTVNGEILRLQSELKRRWTILESSMQEIERTVENVQTDKPLGQLRDSVSTIVSNDKSWTSSNVDSAQSSPASSIILGSRQSNVGLKTPTAVASDRLSSTRRISELPRKTITPRPSFIKGQTPRSVSTPVPRITDPYIAVRTPYFRDFKEPVNKPRWSSAANANNTPLRVPRDFPPLSATEPSQFRREVTPSPRKYTPSAKAQQTSHIPLPSAAIERSASPTPNMFTPSTGQRTSRVALPPRASTSLGNRSASSSAAITNSKLRTPTSSSKPPSKMRSVTTPSTVRRQSNMRLVSVNDDSDGEPEMKDGRLRPSSRMSFSKTSRPPSSLSNATGGVSGPSNGRGSPMQNGRRNSLQTPQGIWSRGNGRDSRQGSRGAEKDSEKGKHPRWVY